MRVPPRPLTLRGRLIAALLVFSAVGLVVFAGASVLLLRYSLLNQVDQRLSHTTTTLLLLGGRLTRLLRGARVNGCPATI